MYSRSILPSLCTLPLLLLLISSTSCHPLFMDIVYHLPLFLRSFLLILFSCVLYSFFFLLYFFFTFNFSGICSDTRTKFISYNPNLKSMHLFLWANNSLGYEWSCFPTFTSHVLFSAILSPVQPLLSLCCPIHLLKLFNCSFPWFYNTTVGINVALRSPNAIPCVSPW